MGQMPTIGQLVTCLAAAAFLAAGGAVSLSRVWVDRPWSMRLAWGLGWVGMGLAAVTLAWHSVARGSWLPLEDNFDALIWLGLILGLFVFYVQHRRPVGGLDWFVMPLVIGLLMAAALFGSVRPHEYVVSAWSWVHGVTAYAGAGAFCVAGAAGAMYLIAYERLRRKAPPSISTAGGTAAPHLASLERVEEITLRSATLGFSLLTVAMISGLVIVGRSDSGTRLGPNWFMAPKVLLTAAVWVTYALVLHAPINPSFRGRRAALLSIVGLALMVGTVVAVELMPRV
jgi:ABC-type transport system involved in cytochrome c biogenesis permease subunit